MRIRRDDSFGRGARVIGVQPDPRVAKKTVEIHGVFDGDEVSKTSWWSLSFRPDPQISGREATDAAVRSTGARPRPVS